MPPLVGLFFWKILSDYSIALSFYNEWLTTQDTTCLDSAKVLMTSFTTNYPTDKRTPRGMMTLADVYYSLGDVNTAIEFYDKIINFDASRITNINPELKDKEVAEHKELVTQARLQKANLLLNEMNKPEEALKEYEALEELKQYKDEIKLSKAICLITLERYDEAKVILQNIIDNGSELKEIAEGYLLSLDGE